MTAESSSSSNLVAGLLGTLFIGLRLTGYIDWPWIWVLAPFWGPLALALAILLLFGLAMAIQAIIKSAGK